MKSNEFFNILMDDLKDIPEVKLQEIISYYNSQLSIGLASDKTEDEIINSFGDPYLITAQVKNEYLYEDNDITPQNKQSNNDTDIIIDSTETNNKTDIIHQIETQSNKMDFEKLHYTHTTNESKEDFNSTNNTKDNFNETNNNSYPPKNRHFSKSSNYINTILKICIAILAFIIFSPFITAIIGCILGMFGLAIGILAGSIGLLIGGTFTSLIGIPDMPMFISNFPYAVIVLFTLGSISLALLLMSVFYYICKLIFRIFKKCYNSYKNKGGIF